MSKQAKAVLAIWAEDFAERCTAGLFNEDTLRQLHQEERTAHDDELGRLRRAMAALEFPLFATALVNFVSQHIAREKVRIVRVITGQPVSQREFWNRLDRVYFYVDGHLFERTPIRPRVPA